MRWAWWLRRRPLEIPYSSQLPALTALLEPDRGRISLTGDEQLFLTAAEHHNLLTYALLAHGRGRLILSQARHRHLKDAAARRVIHARLLEHALPSVVAALKRQLGVPPVLVKGPAVAIRYYPDPSLRPFVDLDLLVPRARLEMAAAALQAEGYEREVEYRRDFTAQYGHDIHLVRPGPPRIDVELHWRMGDDQATSGLGYAYLADSAEELVIENESVLAPSVPADLLVLSAHLLSDRNRRLCWIHDIYLAASRATAEEWQEAFAQADRLGLSWVLHRALDYALRHLYLRRERPISPREPPPFGPLRAGEEINGPAALHIGRLAALDWSARARYLAAVIAPSREGMLRTVGSDDASTLRLAGRHLVRGFRLLRRFQS